MASTHKPQSTEPVPMEKYNILLIGETGSGKSTLVNYLTNFFLGGSLYHLKIAIPTKYYAVTENFEHSERDIEDSTKSQTIKPIEYDFKSDELQFSFIDTPGLCDTASTQNDEDHITKILAAAEEAGTLAAIMIVINGTRSRATVDLSHSLNEMKSFVPDCLLDNLMIVLTNCNRATANFELKQLKPWKILDDNVFYMNNSALSKPQELWSKDEKLKQTIENEWTASMETMEQIKLRLKQIGMKVTNVFKEMRLKRNQIKSELFKILQEVEKLQNLQNDLNELKSAQQNVLNDIKMYSNYTQTKTVNYVEYVDSQYYSRICSNCQNVCYKDWAYICSITGYLIPTFAYQFCNMTSNIMRCAFLPCVCDICKCSPFMHYDDTRKPIRKTKTVQEILDSVKAAYDSSVQKNEAMLNQIGGINVDMAALNAALDAHEATIRKCCQDLKNVCSQFNLVKELSGIIGVMEKAAENLKSVEARKNAHDRIRKIQLVIDELTRGKNVVKASK